MDNNILLKLKLLLLRRKKVSTYVKSELLSDKTPFIISEAYKAMRTNLMFMLSDNKKLIAFTSTLAGEGKTTTCLNMGISFAQAGNRVLIIDMDMRKPRVHRYFEVPSSPGLSDRLGGFTKELPVEKTQHENLFVLPVGTIPPSPPELLMSNMFDEILSEVKDKFDYIFLDTPPIHLVTDLAIIAGKLDGVVFVVRENTAAQELITQAIDNLKRVDAKILGFILNDSVGSSLFTQYKYKRRYKARYGYTYGYSLPSVEKE